MALNVSYRNRIGYYTLTQEGRKFKIYFCHANCTCAMIYFYKDSEGVNRVQLQGWFVDLAHAKRCIKDDFFKDCSNFVFYAKELDKDLWKVIQMLTEKGIKVTIK